ncbi:MAG: CinA family protein [Anaerolineae bacterium]|nr:CinA family protein [Anaerolineae bacterium]
MEEKMVLEEEVGALLSARGLRLAVAESATGGLLGHYITGVSGSSRYFWGGVIAYANDVKHHVLSVREETLTRWGAVSPQVAREMALGVCAAIGVEVGLSITGIAGPTGATPTKPVGLYYIGMAFLGECWVWRHLMTGERAWNNEMIARGALEHLRLRLQ